MEAGFVNILRSLTDPLVLFHENDGDLIPEDLKFRIEIERMAQTVKAGIDGKIEKATDLEAMAYLMSASLALPLGTDWVNIYSYLVYNYVKKRKKEVPDFLKGHSKISDYEQKLLDDLKVWIKKKQDGEYSKRKPELKSQNHDSGAEEKQQKLNGFLKVA